MTRSDQNSTIAFLSVRTQYENVGDALINRELVRQCALRGPIVVDVSRCPASFLSSLDIEGMKNVTLVRRFGFAGIFSRILISLMMGYRCVFFLVPGGMVGEKTRRSEFIGQAYIKFLAIFKIFGLKLAHLGVSYENLGPKYKSLVKARSNILDYNYVRDELSAKLLRSFAAPVTGIMPDLAFGLPKVSRSINLTTRMIAVSFRTDRVPDYSDVFRELIRSIIDSDPEVHVRYVIQVKRDAALMQGLAKWHQTNFKNPFSVSDISESLGDAQAIYLPCDMILSNRLHALLIGMSAGTVPLAIVAPGRDIKIRAIFEGIALHQNLIDIGLGSVDALRRVMMFGDTETALSADSSYHFSQKALELKALFDGILEAKFNRKGEADA